jgi:hypothetical protein
MLILKFPERPLSGAEGDYIENFFYKREVVGWHITPQTGFYLFMPIALVLLPLSGLVLLPKGYTRRTKTTFFSLWGLYFATMLVGIIKGSVMRQGWGPPAGGYLGFLGLVPFSLNFFIQLALLLDQKSFLKWAGFFKEETTQVIPNNYRRIRRINAGCFLFLYLCFLSGMAVGIYPFSAGGFFFLVVVVFGPLMLLWLLVGDFLLRRWSTHKQLLRDLETTPELFDKPSFIQQIVTPQWSVLKKRLVLKQIALGTYDLSLIAQRSALSLETVKETVQEALNSGTIQGALSEDYQTFIPEK